MKRWRMRRSHSPRHRRMRNRAARASALSSAVRQSLATEATTTDRAIGPEFHLAALVDAAAGAVHVRHLHLGAWHQPAQTSQHEAHAALGQVAQFGGLRMAGLEEHLHHGSPSVEGQTKCGGLRFRKSSLSRTEHRINLNAKDFCRRLRGLGLSPARGAARVPSWHVTLWRNTRCPMPAANAVRLEFAADSLVQSNLSGAAFTGDWLWVAGDEACGLDRLRRLDPVGREASLCGSARLPARRSAGPARPGRRRGRSGRMAVADGFLWVVGSHAPKRKNAKPDAATPTTPSGWPSWRSTATGACWPACRSSPTPRASPAWCGRPRTAEGAAPEG